MKTLNEEIKKMKRLSTYKKGTPLNEQLDLFSPDKIGTNPKVMEKAIKKAVEYVKDKSKEIPSSDEIIKRLEKILSEVVIGGPNLKEKIDSVAKYLKKSFNKLTKMFNEQDMNESVDILSDLDKIIDTLKVKEEGFVIRKGGEVIRLSESEMKKIAKMALSRKKVKEEFILEDELDIDYDEENINDIVLSSLDDFEL